MYDIRCFMGIGWQAVNAPAGAKPALAQDSV